MDLGETYRETWNIMVLDRLYEADFDELRAWIDEGAVTADDMVQRGNLRWLSAGRVPELASLFAKDFEMAPVSDGFELFQLERNGFTEAELNAMEVASSEFAELSDETTKPNDGKVSAGEINHCALHSDRSIVFAWNICGSPFCSSCPSRYGNVWKCKALPVARRHLLQL